MSTAATRFTALDVFRGLTVCFMIIVNTPGDWDVMYAPLKHSDWHGFTPTDLVFPSFLFAVGNALSFAMKRWETMPRSQVVWKILKRTFLIFIIGYLMSWFPFCKLDDQGHLVALTFSDTRIMGVLQHIAICYGIVALMVYFLGYKKTIGTGLFFLVAYWAILALFGVPGAEYSKTGNAVLMVDNWLLGSNTVCRGEDGFVFDLEGILSTLPAVFNVIAGFAVGRFVQQKGKNHEGLSQLLLVGVGMLFVAYCWNMAFPVNKKLWTSSYAVLTVGLDCVILAVIIYLLDFKGTWKKHESQTRVSEGKHQASYFFLVFGRNPLFIYLLADLGATLLCTIPVGDETVYSWLYLHLFSRTGAYFGSLLFALWWMMLCWLAGFLLDRKKIYVKI
jgi:predicted acyltransferase